MRNPTPRVKPQESEVSEECFLTAGRKDNTLVWALGRVFLTPLATKLIHDVAIPLFAAAQGTASSYPVVFLDLPVTGESCHLLPLGAV